MCKRNCAKPKCNSARGVQKNLCIWMCWYLTAHGYWNSLLCFTPFNDTSVFQTSDKESPLKLYIAVVLVHLSIVSSQWCLLMPSFSEDLHILWPPLGWRTIVLPCCCVNNCFAEQWDANFDIMKYLATLDRILDFSAEPSGNESDPPESRTNITFLSHSLNFWAQVTQEASGPKWDWRSLITTPSWFVFHSNRTRPDDCKELMQTGICIRWFVQVYAWCCLPVSYIIHYIKRSSHNGTQTHGWEAELLN